AELRTAFLVESLDALAEIVRLAKPAVAMALELDRYRKRGVFRVVEELFRGTLSERRESAQFVDQGIDGCFEILIGNALRGNSPIQRLAAVDALGAHHDFLSARDADDLL